MENRSEAFNRIKQELLEKVNDEVRQYPPGNEFSGEKEYVLQILYNNLIDHPEDFSKKKVWSYFENQGFLKIL